MQEAVRHWDFWLGAFECFVGGGLIGGIVVRGLSPWLLILGIPMLVLGWYLVVVKSYAQRLD